MKKKDMKKVSEENQQMIDEFDYMANAASATDCTGLIPAGECEEEELDRYQSIYKFGAPTIDRVNAPKDEMKK
ncbi:MAG: hypothetical protein PHQ72_12740 [Hespellia sp.]|nr:hypothetical protein [Hespellia sp.]